MRATLLAVIATVTAASSFGQVISARRATQRIAPLVRPAPPSANPNQVPQQQPVPAPPNYQPQYRAAAPAPAPRPVDPVKAAADKAKNDEKQFDFFKRRAEEGSDHAQYELGLRYLAGRGVAPDEKQGREWLAKAAKNGNNQAAKKLTELGEEKAEVATVAVTKVPDAKPADSK